MTHKKHNKQSRPKIASTAFALVRPPGHHAGCATAEGFCWLNNIAIAVRHALRSVSRVLIIDWDVHHGNGTQEVFYSDPRVLFISMHRVGRGFYPGSGYETETGAENGAGYTVNVPWREIGQGDAEYRAAFEVLVKPLASAFSPELVLVSAGFDAAQGDHLGQLEVTPACFGWMAAEAANMAPSGRCVLALEGGYCLNSTSSGVLACVDAVSGPVGEVVFEKMSSVSKLADESEGRDEVDLGGIVALRRALNECNVGAIETLMRVCEVQLEFWECLRPVAKVLEQALEARKLARGVKVAQIRELIRRCRRDSVESDVSRSGAGCGELDVRRIRADDDSEDGADYFAGLGKLSAFMNDG